MFLLNTQAGILGDGIGGADMHFLKFVFDIGEEAMWLSNLFHIVV
jgi:hypothetical protein